MACKYIQKLMLAMIELLTFILLKVQANDLARISDHPLSRSFLIFLNLIELKLITLPLPLFHPLQCPSRIFTPLNLMKLKRPLTIHMSLQMQLNFVQKKWPLYNSFKQRRNHFDVCLLEGYAKCWTSRHDWRAMKHLTHDVGVGYCFRVMRFGSKKCVSWPHNGWLTQLRLTSLLIKN